MKKVFLPKLSECLTGLLLAVTLCGPAFAGEQPINARVLNVSQDSASPNAASEIPFQAIESAVLEETSTDSFITVLMYHVIVEPIAGGVAIREIILFANNSPFRFAPGQGGQPSGIRTHIPDNAQNVEMGGDLMKCCAIVEGSNLYDTMEFAPGTKTFIISYTLPYSGSSASIENVISYPTTQLDVFLPEPLRLEWKKTASMTGDEKGVPFQISDKTFARYVVDDVARGSTIGWEVTGLPEIRSTNWWMVVFPAGAGLALIFWLSRCYLFGSRKSTLKTPDAGLRESLLDEVVTLDERKLSMNSATYLARRTELLEKIKNLDETGKYSETSDPGKATGQLTEKRHEYQHE